MSETMKVLGFGVRPDEQEFFDSFSEKYGLEMTCLPDGLTMENVGMTRGFDGISCVETCDLSAPVLKKLAKNGVRYVALRTFGYDNVDIEEAEKLYIHVSHAGYSPYAVANYTVMLMLMCIRKALYIMLRSGTADIPLCSARGMEMQNMTVGVIGTGKVGKAVIENLKGFGCRILAYDIHPDLTIQGVEYAPLNEIFDTCDIITLHACLNETTKHIINARTIGRMKQGVILINAAKGALVDTKALIAGIESGKIGGAGIDCFEGVDEIVGENRNYDTLMTNHDYIILNSFQNTIVTPHIAFFTDQTVSDMVECALSNLHLFGSGKPVPMEISARH